MGSCPDTDIDPRNFTYDMCCSENLRALQTKTPPGTKQRCYPKRL